MPMAMVMVKDNDCVDQIRTEQMQMAKEEDDCVDQMPMPMPMPEVLKPIKMLPRKERLRMLKRARENGLPTKFPLFYPPGQDPSLAPPVPPMSDHQLDMLVDHMLSQEHHEEFSVYTGPAQKPGQLSLPMFDEMAREALFSIEIPKRKKKSAVSSAVSIAVSIGKKKVAVQCRRR